jgi:hypothetical protein
MFIFMFIIISFLCSFQCSQNMFMQHFYTAAWTCSMDMQHRDMQFPVITSRRKDVCACTKGLTIKKKIQTFI